MASQVIVAKCLLIIVKAIRANMVVVCHARTLTNVSAVRAGKARTVIKRNKCATLTKTVKRTTHDQLNIRILIRSKELKEIFS